MLAAGVLDGRQGVAEPPTLLAVGVSSSSS